MDSAKRQNLAASSAAQDEDPPTARHADHRISGSADDLKLGLGIGLGPGPRNPQNDARGRLQRMISLTCPEPLPILVASTERPGLVPGLAWPRKTNPNPGTDHEDGPQKSTSGYHPWRWREAPQNQTSRQPIEGDGHLDTQIGCSSESD